MLSISIHKSIPNVEKPELYAYGFQLARGDLEALSKAITRYVWSPIIWNTGRRDRRYFRGCDLLVLDFDEGLRIEDAANRFCDCQHIIAPTKSHDPEGEHRFRVIIPLERPITHREEYEMYMRLTVERYDADPQCKDAARFYFPSTSIYSINTDREAFGAEIPNLAAQIKKDRQIRERQFKNILKKAGDRRVPGFISKMFRDGSAVGKRNITVFRVAIELTHRGFTPEEIFKFVDDSPIILPKEEVMRAIMNGRKKALTIKMEALQTDALNVRKGND